MVIGRRRQIIFTIGCFGFCCCCCWLNYRHATGEKRVYLACKQSQEHPPHKLQCEHEAMCTSDYESNVLLPTEGAWAVTISIFSPLHSPPHLRLSASFSNTFAVVTSMRTMLGKIAAIFVAWVWFLHSLQSVSAQQPACSSYTVETDCYNARAYCRWNPFLPACVDGPPTTCGQLFRDTVGCANNANCAKNIFNNACFTVPTAAPASALCNVQTTVQNCQSNNCYFDAYSPSPTSMGGKCYASFAEVKGLFPSCNTYSYYPSSAFMDACSSSRSCTALTATSLCQNPVGYSPNDVLFVNRVTNSFVFNVLNPSINLDTLQFSAINSIPFQQFLNVTAPLLHTFTFGSTANSPRPLQPSKCNDLLQTRPGYGLALPRINPAFPNTTALYAGLLASKNLVYTTNDALSTALYQATGYTNVGGTSVTQQVYVTPDTVNKLVGGSADWLVANCGSTRTVVSTDSTCYLHQVSEDVQSQYYEATATFFIYNCLYTSGATYFGATQRSALSLFINTPPDTTVNATVPGAAKRRFTAWLTYRSTNPNVVLGLRGLQDVSMVSTGGTAQSMPPTNCLGTHPVSVTPPSGLPTQCTDVTTVPPTYCWTTVVKFEDNYNLPTPDGLALVKCAYQPAAVRIAAMGSDIPFPAGLDGIHDFYVFPKQWALNNFTTGPYTPISADSTGVVGDKIGVTLPLATPVDITYFGGTLDTPQCGILPFAYSPITDLIVPTYYNKNNISFAVDLRNMALDTNSLLIFACTYKNTTRSSFRLNFRDSLELWPLDATGEVIRNSQGAPLATLPWSSLASTVPYTIRSAIGAHVRAVDDQLGVDAFGVVVGDVMARMACNGFAPVIPFYGTLPALPTASLQSRRRRLLQANPTDTSQDDALIQDSKAFFGVLLPANLTQPVYIPDVEAKAATGGLAVVGVLGGVVVGVVAAAAAVAVVSGTAPAIAGVGLISSFSSLSTGTQSALASVASLVGGKPKKQKPHNKHTRMPSITPRRSRSVKGSRSQSRGEHSIIPIAPSRSSSTTRASGSTMYVSDLADSGFVDGPMDL
jgi:hypothetical protein